MEKDPILRIKDLKVSFQSGKKFVPAVDGISFELKDGEILGIVGESGSGKSVTSLATMGLIPSPPGKIENGEIIFEGKDLKNISEKEWRKIRGNQISMIFQEPMTSLNPLFTIGNQLMEAIRLHTDLSKREANVRSIELLKLVGIPRAEGILKEHPHQLSGGMRQRVMIAMAMACNPRVLIADEPTTALDVTIQAQILALMKDLNKKTNTTIILITHDLGVVAEICERVIVMYSGQIVEQGDVRTILKNPQHPYTKGLLKSVPDLRGKKERLYSIPGTVPTPGSIQKGCRFAARCSEAFSQCQEETPVLYKTEKDGHEVRCFLHTLKKGSDNRVRVTS
ncbi:ABC transporter ATP-binding protein [Bacillus sp. ISL-40]|uniref:ABC transporter ATP-binding protein n=1 Tax=unclassified Bacillus (in: firmicutes) TaxID=185979 RepID=UPI001BE7C477|nr:MULTISPECIES: ABC transporter ATP-binding protein [unclassified Bacillus (in: firmicutes)]MBT2699800.1 ABC transporter ATP-binding protein [Bacillus sp. ISL-40]MBT2721914.1 ABC transporter ATP-binding protein [Bacillus sp. ISL-46]MBT2743309.1 ABC transporter ATP-binding protein [Bacillus sp. ISL-77]